MQPCSKARSVSQPIYYQKNINQLLYNPEIPGTYGRGIVPYVNIAEMKDKGIDLSVSGHMEITKDFRLDATLSFTTYSNKITKVTDQTDFFLLR